MYEWGFMSLLMFQEYRVQPHLSEDEVWNRLRKNIGQSGVIKEYMFGSTPYFGSIRKPIFTASRIDPLALMAKSNLRNQLVVQGCVIPKDNHCEIIFTISPRNVEKRAVVVMAWITGSILFLCIAGAIIGKLFNSPGTSILLGFLGLIISFFYLIRWLQFKLESITDRNFFCDLFEVQIE
jgi:hypothetical protein